RQVRADRYGPDAGATAAVRDAERLVQVQVRHVGTEGRQGGHPDQRVEIRPVDVHLAARRVHGRAEVVDVLLVYAGRGRVGDHDRRDVALVRLQLSLQVASVDGTVGVALDHRDAQSGQHGAGRVGAVRRLRDQADVAFLLSLGGVVAADGEQAGQ